MTNDVPRESAINKPMHAPPFSDRPSTSELPASTHADEAHHNLLKSRGAVLSFVFLVAGVVGLPLLWMNPNFSRRERFFWTAIVLLYSLTILILAGGILWWFYQLIVGG